MRLNERPNRIKPLISVIIPTCHRNEDLGRCLDCLVPGVQLLDSASYEVIVSDDGRDTTAEAMIRERYPWVKWTQGPRRGPAANRNHGARLSNSEWLAFTDDDCLPSPGWLAAFVAGTPTADVLEGLTRADRERRSYAEEAPINMTGGYLWSCNFAIRKTVFEMIGGFDENFPAPAMEDCDLRENLREAGIEFKFVRDAELVHPWRAAKGWKFWERYLDSLLFFYQKHPDLRPQYVGWSFVMTGLRGFKNNVFHNFSCFGASSLSHAFAHLIWHFWTALRSVCGTLEKFQ